MKKIIVLTDFSKTARYAANAALELAELLEHDLILVNSYLIPLAAGFAEAEGRTIVDTSLIASQSQKGLSLESKRLHHRLSKKKASQKLPDISTLSSVDSITNTLGSIVEHMEIAMIVTGAHHALLPDIFSAVDINKIIEKTKCPLLVIRQNWSVSSLKNLVLASDLNEKDLNILRKLSECSFKLHYDIQMCHISSPSVVANFNLEDRLMHFRHAITSMNIPNVHFEVLTGTNFIKTLNTFNLRVAADVLAVVYREHSIFWSLFHTSHTKRALRLKLPLLVLPCADRCDELETV